MGQGIVNQPPQTSEADFVSRFKSHLDSHIWLQNTAATEALGKVQATELKLSWWFSECHISVGHRKASVASHTTDLQKEKGECELLAP